MMLYSLSLYTPCIILVIVVRHLSFHFYWIQPVLYSNCKLKIFVHSHRYTTFSSVKQYTVMWQILRLSWSLERARPYVEAAERKLRDVGVSFNWWSNFRIPLHTTMTSCSRGYGCGSRIPHSKTWEWRHDSFKLTCCSREWRHDSYILFVIL